MRNAKLISSMWTLQHIPTGKIVKLKIGQNKIGSKRKELSNSQFVSNHHCLINVSTDDCIIEILDNHSEHGTFVNNMRLDTLSIRLSNNDIIGLGVLYKREMNSNFPLYKVKCITGHSDCLANKDLIASTKHKNNNELRNLEEEISMAFEDDTQQSEGNSSNKSLTSSDIIYIDSDDDDDVVIILESLSDQKERKILNTVQDLKAIFGEPDELMLNSLKSTAPVVYEVLKKEMAFESCQHSERDFIVKAPHNAGNVDDKQQKGQKDGHSDKQPLIECIILSDSDDANFSEQEKQQQSTEKDVENIRPSTAVLNGSKATQVSTIQHESNIRRSCLDEGYGSCLETIDNIEIVEKRQHNSEAFGNCLQSATEENFASNHSNIEATLQNDNGSINTRRVSETKSAADSEQRLKDIIERHSKSKESKCGPVIIEAFSLKEKRAPKSKRNATEINQIAKAKRRCYIEEFKDERRIKLKIVAEKEKESFTNITKSKENKYCKDNTKAKPQKPKVKITKKNRSAYLAQDILRYHEYHSDYPTKSA